MTLDEIIAEGKMWHLDGTSEDVESWYMIIEGFGVVATKELLRPVGSERWWTPHYESGRHDFDHMQVRKEYGTEPPK